jgi:hypothetical protein
MYCGCDLIECAHNESLEHSRWFRGAGERGRWHGSPASNYRYPWPQGDNAWCARPAAAYTCRQLAMTGTGCGQGNCDEEIVAALG